MSLSITIIGLGQIGSSFGLALAPYKDHITRIGHDINPVTAKRAKKLGAVDDVKYDLSASVNKSQVVLLALPVDQIKDTLQSISQKLRTCLLVMDTSPAKASVAAWMKELLPDTCQYIGLMPAINPIYIGGQTSGIGAAHDDLFRNGVMAIVAPNGTSGEAIHFAADLTKNIGALPMFSDVTEIDGMMSIVHLLPQLIAAAFLNATIGQPGWQDTRKLAGRPYAGSILPMINQEDPSALAEAIVQNHESILRGLDILSTKFLDLRNIVINKDADTLVNQLQQTREGGQQWWQERLTGDWAVQDHDSPSIPSLREHWKWMVFGERSKKDKRKNKP